MPIGLKPVTVQLDHPPNPAEQLMGLLPSSDALPLMLLLRLLEQLSLLCESRQ